LVYYFWFFKNEKGGVKMGEIEIKEKIERHPEILDEIAEYLGVVRDFLGLREAKIYLLETDIDKGYIILLSEKGVFVRELRQ